MAEQKEAADQIYIFDGQKEVFDLELGLNIQHFLAGDNVLCLMLNVKLVIIKK